MRSGSEARRGRFYLVEYDKEDTLRDLRKTLIDAQDAPSRDVPPSFAAFVLPDGSPVPFKQEHLERVKGFGAHVYIHVLQTKRDHNVSPLGEEQQLQLMRSRNRGVQANEYGVKPTPKISPEYDYLPVVSYAEAADKGAIRPLTGENPGGRRQAAATQLQKRSGSCSPRFKSISCCTTPSWRNARVYEPRNKKSLMKTERGSQAPPGGGRQAAEDDRRPTI